MGDVLKELTVGGPADESASDLAAEALEAQNRYPSASVSRVILDEESDGEGVCVGVGVWVVCGWVGVGVWVVWVGGCRCVGVCVGVWAGACVYLYVSVCVCLSCTCPVSCR